ncbi:hypothetical protein GALL_553190 [mine drainage metagenome]|uniref:Uncharacterized protein n=1 Tax=mine drainage metagenome TaxID=410659 RepID=A0A1J5NWM7_9ZZZZ
MGECAQQRVTAGMAETVVDDFQAIQVDQKQDFLLRIIGAFRTRKILFEEQVKGMTVGDAG